MRTSRGGGVILVGAAGVGKTRLLDEVLDRPPFSTWSTTRFVATEPSRTVPLAALFSLLPPAPVGDRSQMLAYLRSSLLERADGRRVLVAVDDAHLLDDVSAAFLGELVHRDDIVLAVTARSGTPMPSPLTGLWTSGVLERVDIDPLDAAATLELAEDVVGGSIDPSLGAEVVALSGGNPLLIREILLDASSSGTVRPESGAWTSVAPLRSGPRVQELVLARTGRLPAEARAVLDLVAIADPLDLALLDDQESEHLDRLEREGLVELRRGEVGLHARVEHPLVGEAIAASLPTRRRLEVLRALSDRTATAGCPNEGDALRAARWALLAGDVPPARLAAAAANESLRTFDLDTAAELAECALSTGPCSDAAIVLADVRRLQGNTEAARRAVEEGLADATDEHQRARATEVLALLLTHQLGRPSEAVELLRATAAGLGDAGLARRLDGMATHLSGLLGAYPEVVTATRQAIEVEGLDPDERAVLLHNLVYAQVMLGQIDGVDDRIQEALELGAPSATQEIVDLLWALRTGVHVQRGELADGARLAEAHIERCRADGHVFITTGAILCQLLAHLGSVRVFDLADELLAGRGGPDAFGVTPIILGTAAYARARSGDPDGARALLAQVPDDLEDDRTLPFVAAGRAALLTAVGEPLQAAEVALEGGQRAVETTHAAFGRRPPCRGGLRSERHPGRAARFRRCGRRRRAAPHHGGPCGCVAGPGREGARCRSDVVRADGCASSCRVGLRPRCGHLRAGLGGRETGRGPGRAVERGGVPLPRAVGRRRVTTHRSRARHRPPGRDGAVEPGDRRRRVSLGAHRRQPPPERLPEARGERTSGARRGARPAPSWRGGLVRWAC